MATPEEVARWMLNELEKQKELYQEDVVWEIEQKFGDEFVYENENGNPAIDKKILMAFRKLTKKTVVWERGGRYWRFRETYDDPDKRQAD